MKAEEILVFVFIYPIICRCFFHLLMMLGENYTDKMLINDIKLKSPYPIVRWFLYTILFLLTPVVFIIELLKVGFTKDK